MNNKIYNVLTINKLHRFTTIISALWMIVGAALYISILGTHSYFDSVYDQLPPIVSQWVYLINKTGLSVYSYYPSGIIANIDSWKRTFNFNIVGFVVFLSGPILALWITVYCYEWVNKSNDTDTN